MNNYKRIIKYAEENNGYITAKETRKLKISSTYLTNLVLKGLIERVGIGIYKLPEYPLNNFYILSKTNKNMCFSHETALYLHNMSDRIPLVYNVTVPYNYSGNLLNNKNISIKYVNKDIFKLGLIEIKSIDNLPIKVYDIERTICDIIKNKKNIDKEMYSKALKEYYRKKDKNLLNLIKYSKKLGIEKEVIDLMGVLL